jgi:uncharacterized protein YlbG (UPF0298 family)
MFSPLNIQMEDRLLSTHASYRKLNNKAKSLKAFGNMINHTKNHRISVDFHKYCLYYCLSYQVCREYTNLNINYFETSTNRDMIHIPTKIWDCIKQQPFDEIMSYLFFNNNNPDLKIDQYTEDILLSNFIRNSKHMNYEAFTERVNTLIMYANRTNVSEEFLIMCKLCCVIYISGGIENDLMKAFPKTITSTDVIYRCLKYVKFNKVLRAVERFVDRR